MRLFYLLSNLTLRPFDFLPERHWNFCRCKNLDSFFIVTQLGAVVKCGAIYCSPSV